MAKQAKQQKELDKFIIESEAAKMMGLSQRHLADLRKAGMIRSTKIGRSHYYLYNELVELQHKLMLFNINRETIAQTAIRCTAAYKNLI